MIRILQVVNIMDRAGLENMLMNYYRNIDRSKVQFDFLTHRPYKGAYDDEIESLGGKIFYAPRLMPQNYINYIKFMKKFFQEHNEYTIVHSHIEAMSFWPLLTSKMAGIPIRIAHSHNTKIDKDFRFLLKVLFKKLTPFVSNEFAACTKDAGDFLFRNKDFYIINNAIDLNHFLFNEKIRTDKRKELKFDDKCIIGHVGRFTYQKNHFFLLDVFKEIAKIDNKYHLLLVGNGELKQKIEEYIIEHNIDDKVTIISDRDDVNELYQAMDIFLFPSINEGLGISAVEAQISGLHTIISDTLPQDTSLSNNTIRLPLEKKMWIDAILNTNLKKQRYGVYCEKFDIEKNVENLIDYYKGLMKKYEN